MPRARGFSWDHIVREEPKPAKVREIVADYGWDAALERWGWLTQRGLINIANDVKNLSAKGKLK